MTPNITLAIIPVLCLNCTINNINSLGFNNESLPSIVELTTFLERLHALLEALNTSDLPPAPTAPYPSPLPTPEDVIVANLKAPEQRQALPSATAFFTIPISFRQDASTAQGLMSTITSMIAGMMPFNRRQHLEPTPDPLDIPTTHHKYHEEERAVHLDHEHVNEPAASLPDGGVLSGSFFDEEQKANAEYFNEETPQSVAFEVNTNDQVSSASKLYDDKSEHPYYVVDKPADGPAPPPLVYYSSGLRSEDAASSAAAWDSYYAKLREYNEYNDYYYSYYERYGRSKNRASIPRPEDFVGLTNHISLPEWASSKQ